MTHLFHDIEPFMWNGERNSLRRRAHPLTSPSQSSYVIFWLSSDSWSWTRRLKQLRSAVVSFRLRHRWPLKLSGGGWSFPTSAVAMAFARSSLFIVNKLDGISSRNPVSIPYRVPPFPSGPPSRWSQLRRVQFFHCIHFHLLNLHTFL